MWDQGKETPTTPFIALSFAKFPLPTAIQELQPVLCRKKKNWHNHNRHATLLNKRSEVIVAFNLLDSFFFIILYFN